ncbi:15431_t:CDS:2, partial [Cetraspora pellucida]
MGLSKQGIDALATLGITASYRVIAAKRCKLLKARNSDLEIYFQNQLKYAHFLNIDNYHDIHEKQMPNVTLLYSINHMATICVNLSKYCAPISYYSSTGFNIHNPEFIDANIIISKLHTGYMQAFNIAECKEERAMKDVKLVDLIPLNLHSMNDYLKAINTYTQLQPIRQYLNSFIDKALFIDHNRYKNGFRDAFVKSTHYPYTQHQLKQLGE